jgi:ABC-type amino acid transport substrate-binding protein
MNNKSLIAIVLSVIAIIIAILGINRGGQQSGDETLARIQKNGSVNVCVIVSPPYVIKDAKTGKLSGHMYDAMKMITDRMKVKMNVTETTYGNGVAELQSRRCDVVVADYYANIPRSMAVAFTSPPLIFVGQSAVVRKDDTRFQDVKNIFDFDKPNITVAVATGDTGDVFVKENFKNAKINRIDVESSDLSRFMVEVSAGRADIAISDANITALYAKSHPEVINLFKDNPFGLNPVGWAVRQNDTAWLHFLEGSLQFLETQGALQQLENKYNSHWLHEVKEYKIR